MMNPPLLSRARLKRSNSIRQLLAMGQGPVSHNLVWMLFSDTPDHRRDFLFREDSKGVFYILSTRPPSDPHHLFDLDPAKPFMPRLQAGDILQFSLRANPVVRRNTPRMRKDGKGRDVPVRVKDDVIMAAMHDLPKIRRAECRHEMIQTKGREWLEREARRKGFAIYKAERNLRIDGYQQARITRKGAPPLQYSSLDFDGLLQVTAPPLFLASIKEGFGSARGFGCGLMLIKRPGVLLR